MKSDFNVKRCIASILALLFMLNTLDFIPGMAVAIAEQSKIEVTEQEAAPVSETIPEPEPAPASEPAPVSESAPVQESVSARNLRLRRSLCLCLNRFQEWILR